MGITQHAVSRVVDNQMKERNEVGPGTLVELCHLILSLLSVPVMQRTEEERCSAATTPEGHQGQSRCSECNLMKDMDDGAERAERTMEVSPDVR